MEKNGKSNVRLDHTGYPAPKKPPDSNKSKPHREPSNLCTPIMSHRCSMT